MNEFRKYILTTSFNLSMESDDYGNADVFAKKVELLCLEYDVEIDWEEEEF